MAIQRDQPYEGSSFLVDIGTYGSDDVRATFCRVELPAATVDELAYRSGNERTQETRREPGLVSYGHLVLKRGLIGSTDLWEWWKQSRSGDRGVDRNVNVTLLDEERNPVWVWRFRNAFPVEYRITPLDSAAGELLVEELELAFDSMDID